MAGIFADMTEEQRAAVRSVVKDASSGTLYWAFVKLEHFPSGGVYLKVEPRRGPYMTEALPECHVNDDLELHQLYLGWIEQFSEHAEP